MKNNNSYFLINDKGEYWQGRKGSLNLKKIRLYGSLSAVKGSMYFCCGERGFLEKKEIEIEKYIEEKYGCYGTKDYYNRMEADKTTSWIIRKKMIEKYKKEMGYDPLFFIRNFCKIHKYKLYEVENNDFTKIKEII
jgi:hypothetical protein